MSQLNLIQNFRAQYMKQLGTAFWVIVVLLIATGILLIVTNQESNQKMCRLFEDYETTSSERHHILMALGSANLKDFDIENGQVCVPRIQQATYLAAVRDQAALPKIFEQQDELKINPFLLKSQQKQQVLDRKKQQVRYMILRLPFVKEVMFEMDWMHSDSHFKPDQQSAVVLVSSKEKTALTRQQITAIQRIVSGAIAGISPADVVVTDANVGISYGDLKDPHQSELIELVTWQMQRREYYMDQLLDLTYAYPGLEIKVEVNKRNGTPQPTKPADKIAAEVPAKLAALTKMSYQQPRITLNGGGTIEAMNSVANDQLSNTLVSANRVVTASFESTVESTKTEISDASRSLAEIVRIKIRVPAEMISNYEPKNSANRLTAIDKFEALKHEIVSRVKQVLPASAATEGTQISVMMMDSHAGLASSSNQNRIIKEWLRLYWPIGAVAMIGLLGMFWSRKVPAQKPVASTPEFPAPPQDQLLQSQLSELIDTDPAAAASVIKNWIRSSSQ